MERLVSSNKRRCPVVALGATCVGGSASGHIVAVSSSRQENEIADYYTAR